MEQIKQTIENKIYGYDPNEFMPIYRDGQVDNRNAFIAYKARRTLGLMATAAQIGANRAVQMLGQINHAENN
ncbi:MAG TPA: hypothetical protein VH234_05675 [Candidatus Saccharimonadales bacterium]|jgi:hypothetical protein|nr:hypothetical protein [Candidatus Saccharimonadales bacterium]